MTLQNRPTESSYWIYPNQLIAGSYPSDFSHARTEMILDNFHTAGVRRILNLTVHGELENRADSRIPYRCDPAKIQVRRCAIPAGSTPKPSDAMNMCRILHQWIGEGHAIYIHSIDGTARAAMIAAIYSGMRDALPGPKALERVREARKLAGFESEMELNPEQAQFVSTFLDAYRHHTHKLGPITEGERIRGALLGHAVGDALGAGVAGLSADEIRMRFSNGLSEMTEHSERGLRAGETAEDTELPLILAESYNSVGDFDIEDIDRRMKAWLRTGPRDLGGVTREVLSRSLDARDLFRVAQDVLDEKGHRMVSGNGCLTRVAPIGLVRAGDDRLLHETRIVCTMIQADSLCVETSQTFTTTLEAIVLGKSRVDVADSIRNFVYSFQPSIEKKLENWTRCPVRFGFSGGYTLDSLALSLQIFYHSSGFEDGLIEVVNRGGDTDTNAALSGALLGAYYGESAIPSRWVDSLMNKSRILNAADGLLRVRRRELRQASTEPAPGT